MTHSEVWCVQVQCDRCLVLGRTEQNSIGRWATLEEATADLRGRGGWQIGPEIEICGRCVSAQHCLQEGHLWDDWRPIGPVEPSLLFRLCSRCGLDEVAPVSSWCQLDVKQVHG